MSALGPEEKNPHHANRIRLLGQCGHTPRPGMAHTDSCGRTERARLGTSATFPMFSRMQVSLKRTTESRGVTVFSYRVFLSCASSVPWGLTLSARPRGDPTNVQAVPGSLKKPRMSASFRGLGRDRPNAAAPS